MADAARYYLAHAPKGFRNDCSGFVNAVSHRAGMGLSGNTRSMWAWAEQRGYTYRRRHPAPGDLVFFDNTYDRNRDGRLNDALTHIGVVIAVQRDGTLTIAHNGTSGGRTTLRMNLNHPSVRHNAGGQVLNDPLRAKRASDPPRTPYLTGELWRGFARLPPPG